MTRIKATHKLKGFRKYQVLDSHESQKGQRETIDTWEYEVPDERVEEAQYLGGELVECST